MTHNVMTNNTDFKFGNVNILFLDGDVSEST